MIYIDTGAFLARHLSKDQYHRQANTFWDSIRKKSETCVTSNFVLDETFTLIGRRTGYGFAAQRARNIYASNRLRSSGPAWKTSGRQSVFSKNTQIIVLASPIVFHSFS